MVAEAFRRYGLGRHLLLVLVLAIGSGVAAHGEVIYPLYELREHEIPDLHDGSLDDWRQVMEPTFRTEDLVRYYPDPSTGEPPPGFPDFAVEIFLAWSSARNQILMGVEIWDDVHVESPELPSMMKDHFQLGVDGDGRQPGRAIPVLPDIWGTQAQVYRFYTDRGERKVRLNGISLAFDFLQRLYPGLFQLGGETFRAANHTRHVIQFAVKPFDHIPGEDTYWIIDHFERQLIPSQLQPGGLVRLMLDFADIDFFGDQHCPEFQTLAAWYMTPVVPCDFSRRPISHSTCWPQFQLIGADERPTPVRQRSWGQIKAEELQEHPLPPDTDGIPTGP